MATGLPAAREPASGDGGLSPSASVTFPVPFFSRWSMPFLRTLRLACGALLLSVAASNAAPATEPPVLTQKMNAYVGCMNRLSSRSFESKARYFSWVGKNGPTGRERIIYGTYTIYDTSDCRKAVEKANALDPHEPDLEAAATAYVTAVTALEPLLKEANDYYDQENYKDDKMAKGKALHPRLVAAWDAFSTADAALRTRIDEIQDRRALERLAEIEKAEGRSGRYYVESLMIEAKRVVRAETAEKPDLGKITEAVTAYEAAVKGVEASAGSSFVGAAKTYLVSAKQLMRRIRDKVPYSTGDKMMLSGQGSGWMVEGSPPRVLRDYNDLVSSYNRGPQN